MDSLGSHFEFSPHSSLHIGSDDWNRPVRGCMLVAKAGRFINRRHVYNCHRNEKHNRQTRQNVEDGYSNRNESTFT